MSWYDYEIPDECRIAKVLSLSKKWERKKTESYKGISLLNTPYKLKSKIINATVHTLYEVILLEEHAEFWKYVPILTIFSL